MARCCVEEVDKNIRFGSKLLKLIPLTISSFPLWIIQFHQRFASQPNWKIFVYYFILFISKEHSRYIQILCSNLESWNLSDKCFSKLRKKGYNNRLGRNSRNRKGKGKGKRFRRKLTDGPLKVVVTTR